MALRYALLLALAFAGVSQIQGNDVMPWLITMTAEERKNNTKCKTTELKTILKGWVITGKCFDDIAFGVPINLQQCHSIKPTIIDALQCFLQDKSPEHQQRIETSLDRLFHMLDLMATEFKEFSKEENHDKKCFSRDRNIKDHDSTETKLENCINDTLGVKLQLWNFASYSNFVKLSLLTINDAYYRGKGAPLKQCMLKVFNEADDCDTYTDTIKSLFEKAENGAASIPITSMVLMIGTSLFSMYFIIVP